ncbi:DNA repair protein XRCC4-like [Salvelinus sp. IW2-2015]|uniref:DNA repair protein XRCC4-like n=1 Tax=Salvelinus sp. IW2-2015 TaxID=2691554 RepID=UPI0038D497E9
MSVVSEDAEREEAEELEVQTECYIQDLQQALSGTGTSSTDYSFTLTSNPGLFRAQMNSFPSPILPLSPPTLSLLGSVLFCEIQEPVEDVRALLTHGLERGTPLQNFNHSLKEENPSYRLSLLPHGKRWGGGCSGTSVVRRLESELYSHFFLVMNDKKAKIHSLQENITHLQETSRSPLDDSLNDITDMVPCRKRHFRHLQPPDTVAKRPTSEPA